MGFRILASANYFDRCDEKLLERVDDKKSWMFLRLFSSMTCRVVLAPPDFVLDGLELRWVDWLTTGEVSLPEDPEWIAERERRYYARREERRRYRRERRRAAAEGRRAFRLRWRTEFDPYKQRPHLLYLKTLTRKTLPVRVDLATDSVYDLYVLFAEAERFEDYDCRLLWAGRQLDHGRMLSEYAGLLRESTVHAIFRLRGD